MIDATLCRVSARMRLIPISLAVGFAFCVAVPAAATTLPSGFNEVDLSNGDLSGPTAVTFAPDGRKFVAEKSGRVRVVAANGGDAYRPDLAFERAEDGTMRGSVVWSRDAGGGGSSS